MRRGSAAPPRPHAPGRRTHPLDRRRRPRRLPVPPSRRSCGVALGLRRRDGAPELRRLRPTHAATARCPRRLVALVLGVCPITLASTLWLTRVSGWSRDDALLASVPGALSTVMA